MRAATGRATRWWSSPPTSPTGRRLAARSHSTALHLTERFTRVDPQMIDYEITVNDPQTFTRPFTMRLTITSQPDYQIYEYACHEGNHSMRNVLSAERAYEREAADAKAKGLPPPPRVFEQVNGPDRAR